MPQWGRPPGARLGRPTGGGRVAAAQRMWDDRVVTEIDEDSEDYGYGPMAVVSRDRRAAVPSSAAAAAAVTGEWEWFCNNNMNYNKNNNFINGNNYGDADDVGSVADGMEYDLYDDTDRTVAYAVELALRDREDWLVERALERIRRAQGSGNNNVRLSMRELDALERRRMGGPGMGLGNGNGNGSGNSNGNGYSNGYGNSPKGNSPKGMSPRGMSTSTKRSPGQPPESPTRSRTRPRRSISDNDGHHHHHHHHHHHLTPPKTSPQRPRTPLNQSRSQDSNMWSRSSQLISFLTPSRRNSQASPSFPRRDSNERHISRKAPSSPLMESDTDMDKGQHDSGDDVQIVDVQQRRVPATPQPRPRISLRSGSGSSGRRR